MIVSKIQRSTFAAPEYTDLDVCIRQTEEGQEWKFTVSRDNEDGTIYDGPNMIADDKHCEFDEAGDIPVDVQAAFDAIHPKMVEQLEAMKEGN